MNQPAQLKTVNLNEILIQTTDNSEALLGELRSILFPTASDLTGSSAKKPQPT